MEIAANLIQKAKIEDDAQRFGNALVTYQKLLDYLMHAVNGKFIS
jgi:hypothetical protein